MPSSVSLFFFDSKLHPCKRRRTLAKSNAGIQAGVLKGTTLSIARF